MITRWQVLCYLALGVVASAVFAAAQKPLIQRGEPQFQGDHWTEQIHCQIPVKPGGRLVLRANPGAIEVRPGANGLVECLIDLASYGRDVQQARACLDHYQIKALQTPEGALIEGSSACGGNMAPTNATFNVSVPLRFNLDLKTQGGSVDVEKLEGQLRAQSAGGDIRTGNVLGPVWASTAGGTILLGDIGNNVQARTVGGNIQVQYVNGSATLETQGGEIRAGVINGPVMAQTAGGDIFLQAASGPVQVSTAGGQIRLGECGNSVRAQTAGGNIQVDGARGGVRVQTAGGSITLLKARSSVMAETMAGRILAEIDANRQTFGPSHLETQVGDVDVFIPPALPITINADIGHTMGHRIISDFPIKIERAGSSFGAESAAGQLNGGGHPLDIRTVMGNIQIRKLDPAAIARLEASQKQFWKNWEQFSHQHDVTLSQMISVVEMMKMQKADLQKQLQDLNRQLKDLAPVEYLGGQQ